VFQPSLTHNMIEFNPIRARVKQLINNACQLKLQSGVFGVTSLFISYDIKVKSMCVCLAAGEEIDIFMMHLLIP